MILQAIGHLLPLAVAVAISSVPIMAVLLILLSPTPRNSSIAYLAGWVLGIAALAVAFSAGAAAFPATEKRHPDFTFALAQIVIGISLEAFALALWRRSDRNATQEMPKWLRVVGAVRPWQAFGFAFALNLRPKALLLSAAAGVVLTAQPLTAGSWAVALVVYTVISASTIGIPVLYAIVNPASAQPRLEVVRDWILQNNRIITILVMVVIGFVILGNGLTLL